MVDAAQPVLLVAAEEERCPAVGAVGAEQAHAAGGVAEGDEVLPEESDPQRVPVRVGQLGGEQGRDPVLAQQVAHRGARANTGQQLILFLQHAGDLPSIRSR